MHYIELVGPHAESKAEMVAKHYNSKVIDGTCVEANDEIGDTICMSEETLEAACQELTDVYGIRFVPDDFEF